MKICAVVVTYHPDLETLARVLAAIGGQVAGMVIVDNGSGPEVVQWLGREAAEGGMGVIALPTNSGVAAAQNRGIEWAQARGYSHVLLFDQDSVPAPDMAARLAEAFARAERTGQKIAAVGPRYLDPVSGHASFFVRFGPLKLKCIRCDDALRGQLIPVDFLISSGALISLATIEAVGAMDEGLFIDHVDTEWFLRAKAQGYAAYGVCDAVMEHSLGDGAIALWLGRWRFLPRHSPLRHYYTFRNSAVLYRRRYAPRRWIVNDMVRLAFMLLFYSTVTAPRLRHLTMMVRGLWHGLHGESGPYRACKG